MDEAESTDEGRPLHGRAEERYPGVVRGEEEPFPPAGTSCFLYFFALLHHLCTRVFSPRGQSPAAHRIQSSAITAALYPTVCCKKRSCFPRGLRGRATIAKSRIQRYETKNILPLTLWGLLSNAEGGTY